MRRLSCRSDTWRLAAASSVLASLSAASCASSCWFSSDWLLVAEAAEAAVLVSSACGFVKGGLDKGGCEGRCACL